MSLIGVCKKYSFVTISTVLWAYSVNFLSTALAQDSSSDGDSGSGVQSHPEQLKKRLETDQTRPGQQAADAGAAGSSAIDRPVEKPEAMRDSITIAEPGVRQTVSTEADSAINALNQQAERKNISDSVDGDDVLLRQNTENDPVSRNNRLDAAVELAFWDSIKNSGDAMLYQSYLDTFPQGVFVEAAQAKLQAIGAEKDKSTLAQEVLADEIDALLSKAWAAYERRALTTPEEDSALKWAEQVYEIDPENAEADKVLLSIIDTYLGWSRDKLRVRRLRSASRYLAKGRSLERYANEEQQEAMVALAAKIKRERRRLAKRRRQKRQDTSAVVVETPAETSDDSNWLQRVDKKLQSLGDELDKKFGNK